MGWVLLRLWGEFALMMREKWMILGGVVKGNEGAKDKHECYLISIL